jgi:hypothetical protein
VGHRASMDGLEKRERALSTAEKQAQAYPSHNLVTLLATLSWLPIQLLRAESMKCLQWQSVCQQAHRHNVTVDFLVL